MALVVRLGQLVIKLEFVVCTVLAAPVLMYCDYCDHFINAIQPCLDQIELRDETVIPLVRHPLKRGTKLQIPLPAAQKALPAAWGSTKLRRFSLIVVPPESQVMVSVNFRQHGLKIVKPIPALYERY